MVDKTAEQLIIYIGSAYSVVHDKVCARWVPKELTDEHKRTHLAIRSHPLARYRKEVTTFCNGLSQVMKPGFITVKQKPSRRARNGSIRHLLLQRNLKTLPSADKLMLTIFWDSQGPILETFLEHGTTVTSATYCDMLQRGLMPAICSKRRGRLSEGVLLLRENAHPHTVARTLETLRKLKWKDMEHPVHIPDLAPPNFHPFGPLREALGTRRF
jgi:hypothetical protein